MRVPKNPVVLAVAVAIVATTTAATTTATTPTTLVPKVKRYQQRLTSATSSIVGPMESIHPTTVVVAPTSSLTTKTLQSTPTK